MLYTRSLALLPILLMLACAAPDPGPPPPPLASSNDETSADAELEGGDEGVPEEEVAVLETSLGLMTFRFFDEDAPRTVAQVKRLITDGFYDGIEIYRVVQGHVIQFGDGGENRRPTIPGEFGGPPHTVGMVGLARDADPDSGKTELYICLAARPHLDGSYATFGKLIQGYDTLAKIGAVPVDERFDGPVAMHRPKEPVIIEKAYLLHRPVPVRDGESPGQ